MNERLPAILGGSQLFARPRPIGQFSAPPLAEVLDLVGSMRNHSNALIRDLERDLAQRHDVPHCVVVGNAGLGLMMLLRLLGGEAGGEVIMPAFTFRGLPHFARWAGFEPRFCDVDEVSHALSPLAVTSSLTRKTRAVLSVCNFNDPGDISGLTAVAERAGIPLVFDSVYATGSSYAGFPLGRNGAAEVFSLHATKLVNGFEGGYVTTSDAALADLMRRQRDANGFPLTSITAQASPTLDAELHPYHAAMALRSLAQLRTIVAGNRARYEAYERVFNPLLGLQILPYRQGEGEDPHYELTILEVGTQWPLTRDETLRVLRAEGAVISAYYSPPLHRPPYALQEPSYALPATDSLASRFMQLPGGELMSIGDIEALGDVLNQVPHNPGRFVDALRVVAS